VIDFDGFSMKDIGLGFSDWIDFIPAVEVHFVAGKLGVSVFRQDKRGK
jgi:hypothetical protein